MNELFNIFEKAPREVKDLLADMMVASILESDFPEESKIELRITKVCQEIHKKVDAIMCDYANPMPFHEPEGKEAAINAYPTRKSCLEYLELVKGGLDTFRQEVPAPYIPEKYRKQLEEHRQN